MRGMFCKCPRASHFGGTVEIGGSTEIDWGWFRAKGEPFCFLGEPFCKFVLEKQGEFMIAINVMLSIIVLIGIVDIICLFGSKKKW